MLRPKEAMTQAQKRPVSFVVRMYHYICPLIQEPVGLSINVKMILVFHDRVHLCESGLGGGEGEGGVRQEGTEEETLRPKCGNLTQLQ